MIAPEDIESNRDRFSEPVISPQELSAVETPVIAHPLSSPAQINAPLSLLDFG